MVAFAELFWLPNHDCITKDLLPLNGLYQNQILASTSSRRDAKNNSWHTFTSTIWGEKWTFNFLITRRFPTALWVEETTNDESTICCS